MATVTRRLAALLGASGAGLTDSATASKITTDSINDDAVTSAKIGTDQVGADALSSSAIAGAADIPANSVGESELSVDYTAQSVPHIIPGVLQPAIGGKLLNGANHSGAYGTAQTQSGGDGHKYYYTDIKGSKPIKDPRIGAHFGSQRHKAKSIQILEQETATHGQNVYSIDGREWMRITGPDIRSYYNDNTTGNVGTGSAGTTGTFLEIVGYFSDANYIQDTHTAERNIITSVDGGSTNTNSSFVTSVGSPLSGRYVDEGSVGHLNLPSTHSTTLGIHTLKINWPASNYPYFHGIELIAQDTTSTANRSKIQIPAQNVVSFGKKFPISATADHYDPFSAKTDGSAWTSPTSGNNTANSAASWPTNIDTTHSLGLENWVNGSSYYRPYNGGRVVKYVDSTGTIKTAVTVMPPNARSIADAANLSGGVEKGDDGTDNSSAAAPNDNFKPTFTDQPIASVEELYEVAKTFHIREFGNGAANAGTNQPNADASMLSTTGDDIAYTMDDGLTSMSAHDYVATGNNGTIRYLNSADGEHIHITFIGTGYQQYVEGETRRGAVVQNLPYGTHVVRLGRMTGSSKDIDVDGVKIIDNTLGDFSTFLTEVTFFQPKKPPIPEDAVVLADYMLMADFVPATSVDGSISKGVRYCNASRDVYYDSAASIQYNAGYPLLGYQWVSLYNNNANNEARFTAFGSAYESHYVRGTNRVTNTQARLDGSNYSYVEADVYDTNNSWDDSDDNGTLTKAGGGDAFHMFGIKNQTLGMHTFGDKNSSGSNYNAWSAFAVATPIHTSFHYQTFETPFLHELVGGDRNMEQTNLVCSPDGKTWDEVARDTSYIGNLRCRFGKTTSDQSNQNPIILNSFRGKKGSAQHEERMNKDFAIAYNRYICLVDGQYEIFYYVYVNSNTTAGDHRIYVNGQERVSNYTAALNTNVIICKTIIHMKRGDYIQVQGSWTATMALFEITRV